jgi:hypothetical protein
MLYRNDTLQEELIAKERTMHPVGKPLGSNNRTICKKICAKMQFIKYQTGMRIFVSEDHSAYKMVTLHGIILMLLAIFAFWVMIIKSGTQVGY